MRKYILNQLIELLDSVDEGARQASALKPEAAFLVLNDCYAAVQTVGQMLEEGLPRQSFDAYPPLQEKCLQALQALNNAIEEGSGKKAARKELRKGLACLRKAMEEEPAARCEVVFFPYNASMWDSMESVWQAAREDARCDVYVVPLPYHQLNPDGSVFRRCWEGDRFPEEVPITRWEEYDLEARRPEIAYIHNSFDQHNKVTRIDERYYSHRLKEWVGTLVYIPYYTTGEGLTTLPHVQIAGASAADFVIAQHEEDKELFAQHAPQKRVEALGSPKVDRIIRLERDNPPLPAEWKMLLGKKVLLLNTSLSSMLSFGEGFLDKLEEVLDSVGEHPGLALLWRPHPLAGATMSAMRGDLITRYRRLEDRFLEEGLGVLDQTADTGRAIALADAYIGEASSSLVYLFSLTGKPLYLLQYGKITFQVSTGDEDTAWAFSTNDNGLFRLSLPTGEAEYLGSVPANCGDAMLYRMVTPAGQKVILSAGKASEAAIYDIPTRQFEMTPFPQESQGLSAMGRGYPTEDAIWFPPGAGQKSFAQYHRETAVLKWMENLKKVGPLSPLNEKQGGFGVGQVAGSSLWLPLWQRDALLELNTKTGDTQVHRLGSRKHGYGHLALDGTSFWMTHGLSREPMEPTLFRWDRTIRKVTEHQSFPVDFQRVPFPYASALLSFDGFLLIFFWRSNMIVRVDTQTGFMEPFPLQVEGVAGFCQRSLSPAESLGSFAIAYRLDQNTVLALLYDQQHILQIDVPTGKARLIPIRVKPESMEKRSVLPLASCRRRDGCYPESIPLPLCRFLEELLTGRVPLVDRELAKKAAAEVANGDGSCGERIHQLVLDDALQS